MMVGGGRGDVVVGGWWGEGVSNGVVCCSSLRVSTGVHTSGRTGADAAEDGG